MKVSGSFFDSNVLRTILVLGGEAISNIVMGIAHLHWRAAQVSSGKALLAMTVITFIHPHTLHGPPYTPEIHQAAPTWSLVFSASSWMDLPRNSHV